jgi:argininosuccinate lyase
MKIRQRLLDLARATIDFRKVLIELAAAHTATVMPGYTHLQRAHRHATTTSLRASSSDFGRVGCVRADEQEPSWPRSSRQPLSFESRADRRTAWFLGLLRNGRDLTDRDYSLEAASGRRLHDASALATDLYESTSEFGLVRVDDSDAMTSSMMPQKANPVLLEDIRARTAFAIGDLVSVFAVTKGSAANNIEHTDGVIPALDAIYRTKAALGIFAQSLPRMKFDTQRMKRLVSQHWSQATDLADAIVGSTKLSFREAHRVVPGSKVHCIRNAAGGVSREPERCRQRAQERVDFSLEPERRADPQKVWSVDK